MPDRKPYFSKNKKRLYGLFMLMFSFLLILLGGEIMIRLYQSFRQSKVPSKTMVPNDQFGWKATENYVFKGNVKDASGAEYQLDLMTDENGFRQFGTINSTRRKIFFIGDSFTHAIEVSNDKTYYKIIGDSLEAEVFAYGCGGFGTMQEWMVLEKYIDEIDPDLVVLQFCSNDFINNSFELERQSFFNNSRLTRPYLQTDGTIFFQNTARLPVSFFQLFSQFIPFLATKIERLGDHFAHRNKQSAEHLILANGQNFEPFREAVLNTESLIQKIKKRASPKAAFFVFDVDYFQPGSEAIKQICGDSKIPYTGAVPYFLGLAQEEGKTVYAMDGAHWNEAGHKVAAKVLLPEIEKLINN